MKRGFSWLLGQGLRKGLRRGLLGGERTWLVLGAAALLAKLAARAWAREPEVVFTEELRAGERLVVTHHRAAGHNGLRESPASQPQA